MKQVIPVFALLVVLPPSAQAQIKVDFSEGRPVLRATVAGMAVAASVNSRGKLEWWLDERGASSTSRRSSSATAGRVLATADEYVGTKYVWGGETPSGFDCSGFVQYVFRQHGVELPRTSRQQVKVGTSVPANIESLQVGDLLFFATNGTRIDHVAIYAGNDEIIHSSSSGNGVNYDSFSTQRGQWFVDHHIATRRVVADGESLVGPLTAALRALAEFDPPDRAPRRR
ncbi:MAG TPA: C40 family peptidase [Longimicrobiales bacterium]